MHLRALVLALAVTVAAVPLASVNYEASSATVDIAKRDNDAGASIDIAKRDQTELMIDVAKRNQTELMIDIA